MLGNFFWPRANVGLRETVFIPARLMVGGVLCLVAVMATLLLICQIVPKLDVKFQDWANETQVPFTVCQVTFVWQTMMISPYKI